MKRLLLVLLVLAELSAADGIGIAPQATGDLRPDTLHIALLPDEDPAEILRAHAPFKKHLEAQLGCSIKLTVPHDYSVMIESLRAGRLHLAYMGPASYVLCKDKGAEIEPFAAKMKNGSTTYHSVIVAGPTITALAAIKGGTMGYGDPASTSSHLIPKGELLSAGLEPKRDYKQVFLGSHDAVALNVQAGSVIAGGMSQSIYEKLVAKKTIDPAKVTVVHTSPAFPQYPWVWRKDLAPDLKKKIQAVFLALEDKEILSALHAQGLAAIDDAAYDVVRHLQKTVASFK